MAKQANTLDEVVQIFEHWRTALKRPNSPIPDELRRLAVALHGQYKISHIVRALRLSHSQYQQWLQIFSDAAPTVEFIAIPTITALPNITLYHPHGARLEIAGGLDLAQFACLVSSFVGVEASL